MAAVLLRTILIFAFLIAAVRLTGKRQVGQLQVSELVVTFMLSELAALPLSDRAVPLSHAIVPILTLLCAEVILSYLETKSNRLKKILGGEPSALISRGVLDAKALRRHRIELEELLSELRLSGVFDIADVRYAILEENGRISVKPNEKKCPVTHESAGVEADERGIARALIVDGEINEKAALAVGADAEAVKAAIAAAGVALKDAFLMTADDTGSFTVYAKRKDGVTPVFGNLNTGGNKR